MYDTNITIVVAFKDFVIWQLPLPTSPQKKGVVTCILYKQPGSNIAFNLKIL